MSAYQPVLDPACGGRMFWFDKSDSRVLFGDVRDESWELCDGRRFEVKPDMLMDYRDLPFPDETFLMVVLDPPHLRNAGETGICVSFHLKISVPQGCNTRKHSLNIVLRSFFHVSWSRHPYFCAM